MHIILMEKITLTHYMLLYLFIYYMTCTYKKILFKLRYVVLRKICGVIVWVKSENNVFKFETKETAATAAATAFPAKRRQQRRQQRRHLRRNDDNSESYIFLNNTMPKNHHDCHHYDDYFFHLISTLLILFVVNYLLFLIDLNIIY